MSEYKLGVESESERERESGSDEGDRWSDESEVTWGMSVTEYKSKSESGSDKGESGSDEGDRELTWGTSDKRGERRERS